MDLEVKLKLRKLLDGVKLNSDLGANRSARARARLAYYLARRAVRLAPRDPEVRRLLATARAQFVRMGGRV